MNQPVEYEERIRVKGFSILDDDFESMAADLCSDVEGESGIKRICESVARVVKIVRTLWQDPSRFSPDGSAPGREMETIGASSLMDGGSDLCFGL